MPRPYRSPAAHRAGGLVAFALVSLAATASSAQEADVEIPAAPASAPPAPASTAPAAAAPAAPEAAASSSAGDIEARLRALEARANAPPPPAASAPPPPASAPPASTDPSASSVRVEREPNLLGGVTGPLGLVFSGYVQGQYEASQASEDQLQQGGLPLNQDRFLVRRARLRVDRVWQWASTTLEIDGNTTRGPAFGLRRAEASLVWRSPDREAPPYARLTAGLSEIPFGLELTESSRSRWFMERSLGSLALFPGEPDVGIRLSGGVAFFRYAVAALNGEPVDDRPGRYVRDPNAAKDIVARVGVDARPREKLRIAGGVSFLTGKGFHPGRDATKNGVVWRDLNESGAIDAGELTAVPATAATPSESFSRWVAGADLSVWLDTSLGRSRLYGEVFVAHNADRSVFVADPIASGADAREAGFYVGFLQELGRYAIVGFRTDHYEPNADFFDRRAGRLIPADAAVRTYSPLVGAMLPDRVRVVVQYDAIVDKLARDGRGVPTDLRNDQVTIRLQGEL